VAAIRCPPPVALLAAVLAAAAAVMTAGYLLDLLGLRIHPMALGCAAGAAAVAGVRGFRHAPGSSPWGELAGFSAVVIGLGAFLLWRAWPALLPITDGPDVVHHLQLIHLIQRTLRLAHDPALDVYLLEMMNYTPGSHILAATIAAWLRVDALRVVHPIAAVCVALKSGVLYLIARRVIDGPHSTVQALAAPLLALVPAVYFFGSFSQFFFFAQVVSETFAIAMLLAVVAWAETRARRYLWWFGVLGVGAFLAWPVWIGPPVLTLLVTMALVPDRSRARVAEAMVAIGPIVTVAAVHVGLHAGGAAIVGSSGAVTRPSVSAFGAWFLILAAGGALLAVRQSTVRPVVAFLAATLVQAGVLAGLDLWAGSTSFYMPFKMMYLIILPGAVLGAACLARVSAAVVGRPATRSIAIAAPVVVAALLAKGRVPLTRPHSPIATSTYEAGVWAREHTPPACVDYFSRHWLTGYWLHLDVLGNPRLSDRMRAESFEFHDSVSKWIQGRGLPYAIVEDFAAVPRDARVDMIPLRRFGLAAVVRNTRPGTRPGSDPESSLCRGK
jgi:hypothetical protein